MDDQNINEGDGAAYVEDDAYSDQPQRWCVVYDKDDFFTVFVQLLLAFLALASLYLKRLQEVPRRTFRTWFLDVSKQGIGACYAHVCNMLIAAVISQNIRGGSGDNDDSSSSSSAAIHQLQDQCAWYGISYLIDTTLGLVLAILFLRVLDALANEWDWVHLKHSGVYEVSNHGLLTWTVQVLAWIFILTLVKLIIYAFMWVFSDPLAWLGSVLFAPLQFNIHFELVFVMILFPGVLNVVYFWIADGYLKAKHEHSIAHETTTSSSSLSIDGDKKEALMSSSSFQQIESSSGRGGGGDPTPPKLSPHEEVVGEETPDSFNFYRPLPWTDFFHNNKKNSSPDQL